MSKPTGEPLRPVAATRVTGKLDPRRNVFRPDLAAKSLYGRVSAPRYVEGVPAQIVRPAVPLRSRPVYTNGFETEALFGEMVTVYEENDGWAWVQLDRDKYVGYVPINALSRNLLTPTHRVRAIGTFVYPTADIKSPPLMHLSLNAALRIVGREENFHALEGGGFVVSRHVAEYDRYAHDFVEIAERFIGTPYLWGGRTRIGLDCSGLVQVSLEAAGIAAPRDTDMQQEELGSAVALEDIEENLRRGDLIFWKGHVGIMLDSVTMVHANAHHMLVAVETLPEAVQRISRMGADVLAIKRPPALAAPKASPTTV